MNEERIAELLAELPPAPAAWIRAAQELPRTRREIERLATLAEADAELRAACLADTTAALRRAGLEPAPHVVAALRARLVGP
jgi:ribonuclease PH